MSDKHAKKQFGYRVKAAREAKGWTQDLLSEKLGFSDRHAVSDIEIGRRSVDQQLLQAMAKLLDRDIEYFHDRFAIAGEAQFSWRAEADVSDKKLARFEDQAGRWIGLLRWLREQGGRHTSVLKAVLRLSPYTPYPEVEVRAEQFVAEMELGLVPAEKLIEAIEGALDIPVLLVDMGGSNESLSISSATCYTERLNTILLNRNESEARRFFDLAHELFHALTWDSVQPAHRDVNAFEEQVKGKGQHVEQQANHFAAALLMPRASLTNLIDDTRSDNIEHLCDVAAQLRVAPMILAWRLYHLRMINEKTKRQLVAHAEPVSPSATPKRFSKSFVRMLNEALQDDRLTMSEAERATGLSADDINELIAEY